MKVYGILPIASFGYDIRSHLTSTDSPVYSETAVYDNPANLGGRSYRWLNGSTDTWKGDTPFSLSTTYGYDGLGRLTLSESSDKNYSERLSFDLDANVTDVVRRYRGATVQSAHVQEMDGPHIRELIDYSGPYYSEAVGRFPAGEYQYGYDRNGRTVSDGTRGATITYHRRLDLPKRINIGDGDFIDNDYLPDGTLKGRIFNTKRINTIVKVNSKGDTVVTYRRNDLRRSIKYFGSFEREGAGLKVHTAEGFYDAKEGRHYQYIRNRQGSTMAVVDDSGAVVQRTGYYPTGTPFVLPVDAADSNGTPALDGVTDRLHIGNRWMGLSGLAMYDNSARVHDPVMPHFLTCDSRAGDYTWLSPFSHCAGNPANMVDWDGNDIFTLDVYGNVTVTPNKEKDVLRKTGPRITKRGKVDRSKTVTKEEIFEYGTIKMADDIKGSSNETFLTVSGNDNAERAFKFFSKNTDVEWSWFQGDEKGENSTGYFSTGHLKAIEPGSKTLLYYLIDNDISFGQYTHNHPQSTQNPSESDYDFIKYINRLLNYQKEVRFKIYILETDSYLDFNENCLKSRGPKN